MKAMAHTGLYANVDDDDDKCYCNVYKLLPSYRLFISLFLQQLVYDTTFTWKTYILQYRRVFCSQYEYHVCRII
jgi:hypothetical protein